MKKSIILVLCTLLFLGTSCRTAKQKEADAKTDVRNAQNDLSIKKLENQDKIRIFKIEANTKIKENDLRISELKAKMNKPGKTFDGVYSNKIEKLESKNKDLQNQIDNFDENRTDWDDFRKSFNREASELGRNITDLFR